MKSVTWTQAAQYLILLAAFLTPAAILSMKAFGWPLPQLTYGQALAEITRLETSMIEKGLADAATLKPHMAPFLQLDPLNFFALIFCLMAGTASLPHLLARYLTTPTVRDARTSVAWTGFFVLLFALTIPAYAAFAKLEVYALIDKGTPFSALPTWVETYSRLDLVRIHGVSLKMLDDAIVAVKGGAGDVSGIGTYLQSHQPEMFGAFANLEEEVKAALTDTANAGRDLGTAQSWAAFRDTLLPAAANAAGNKTGMLTASGFVLDPNALVLWAPEIARMPAIVAGLPMAGAMAASLAAATGLAIVIANALGHDIYYRLLDRKAPDARRLAVTRLLLLAVAGGAAYLAALRPGDILDIVAWAFSLAAAGLFPALVLGIWWKRANAWGASLGMLVGFGICLYYLVATRYFAVDFFELWSRFSSADELSIDQFEALKSAWMGATGDAKAAAWSALDLFARGSSTTPGVANWLGVLGVSAAIFAIPLGILAIVAFSLITPRPWPEIGQIVDDLRRPRGPEILAEAASSGDQIGST
jgi:cation/acetate symporter